MFRVDFCLLSQILRKHHHRHKQPEACFHGDSKSNQVDKEVKAWHLRLTFTLQSSEKSKRLDVQSLLAEIVSQPIDWHMQNQNNGIINGHANMKGRNNWLKNLSQYMKKKESCIGRGFSVDRNLKGSICIIWQRRELPYATEAKHIWFKFSIKYVTCIKNVPC